MARILVLSDVHGNIEALNAVLNEAKGYDEVLVLGDLVDYGPNPSEVIDAVRGLGARVVRGNHDHAVAYGVDCRCGEETHWLSTWYRENVTLRLLGENDKAYLAELPVTLRLQDMTAVHAAPSNPLYEYLYPWLGDGEVCSRLHKAVRLTGRGGVRECPGGVYLVGHTHIQYARSVKGTLIVNPGSTGQPRDGIPKAAYALIDADTHEVILKRVKYDYSRVVERLENLRIPDPYLSALKYMLVEASTPPAHLKPGGSSSADKHSLL